ncbi:MAG: HU family DNA-binding protein [Leptolyngbyaceae cyanobacterium RU_5_1]|nr:HU family DNA-binding protein [Leptolyngbyaceae cyanobacterium RU_5_1]
MAIDKKIDKQELVRRVTKRVGGDADAVEAIIDATTEEIYQSLKQRESVTLRDFGTFYIQEKRDSCVFKFNPSQRLRKLFGWSSTYKGED